MFPLIAHSSAARLDEVHADCSILCERSSKTRMAMIRSRLERLVLRQNQEQFHDYLRQVFHLSDLMQ